MCYFILIQFAVSVKKMIILTREKLCRTASITHLIFYLLPFAHLSFFNISLTCRSLTFRSPVVLWDTAHVLFLSSVVAWDNGWNGILFRARESEILCRFVSLSDAGTRWDLQYGVQLQLALKIQCMSNGSMKYPHKKVPHN